MRKKTQDVFHHWLTERTHIHTHKINIQTKIGHTHSRTHVHLWLEEEEEEEGCTGWTFLSADSYRTTSNSKSNLHNSPPSCTVYYTAFPSALQLWASHSNSPLIRPQNLSYRFGEQTVDCRDMIFLLLPLPLCGRCVLNLMNKSSFRKKSQREICDCIALHLPSDIAFHLWSPSFWRPALVFPYQLCSAVSWSWESPAHSSLIRAILGQQKHVWSSLF